MPVVYRPARADDLEPADALVVASINELTERHGFGRMAESSAPQHGMRIRFPMLFMSDADIGDWSGYLPRNPGFM